MDRLELSEKGRLAKEAGKFSEAISWCKKILETYPDDSETIANMAGVYVLMSLWREAIELFEKARALAPEKMRHHNDLLFFLHHIPVSEQTIFEEHLKFATRFEKGKVAMPLRKKNSRTKIRVGYLSSDLHEHATAFILLPILAAHDRSRFKIFIYSTGTYDDWYTEKMKNIGHRWRTLRTKTPAEIRKKIMSDEIDILVDLGGHTGENNLHVFAKRAAPIQVSWFSYMDTSGLTNMDYRITDEMRAHLDREPFYTEKLIRLPNSYTFEAPQEILPEQTPLPAIKNGHITFGSFNTSRKINEFILDIWARILTKIPDSQLIIMVPKGDEYTTWLLQEFENRTIDPTRILPQKTTTLAEFLNIIPKADIALDTYPYTGGTTTYHTLSMGVPTITLEGRNEFERNTGAIMREVELPDFIAHSPEEYVLIAQEKAANIEQLSLVRNSVRKKLGAHTDTLVRNLEQALEEIMTSFQK
jgi:protein O-GlcNAc transferase